MSRSLRDLEEEAFVLHGEATRVESELHDLYVENFPGLAILDEDLEGFINEFEELRDPEFGEMWADFSCMLTRMLNFCRMIRPNAEEVLGYENIELLDKMLEKNNDRDWHTSKMRFHVFVTSNMRFHVSGDTDHPIPYPTKYTNFTDYIMNTARDYENYEEQFGPLPGEVWEHLDAAKEEMNNIYALYYHAKQACEYIGYDLRNTRQERCALQQAFHMGSHHRLGSRSRVRELNDDALRLVTDALHTLDF